MPSYPLGTELTLQPLTARLKLSSVFVGNQPQVITARLRARSITLNLGLVDYQILSANKKYFAETLNQDANNIYIDKTKLPKFNPASQNSLESIIYALLVLRLNMGNDSSSNIQYQLFNRYVDKDERQIVIIFVETFRQKLTVTDYEITDYDEELNPSRI